MKWRGNYKFGKKGKGEGFNSKISRINGPGFGPLMWDYFFVPRANECEWGRNWDGQSCEGEEKSYLDIGTNFNPTRFNILFSHSLHSFSDQFPAVVSVQKLWVSFSWRSSVTIWISLLWWGWCMRQLTKPESPKGNRKRKILDLGFNFGTFFFFFFFFFQPM